MNERTFTKSSAFNIRTTRISEVKDRVYNTKLNQIFKLSFSSKMNYFRKKMAVETLSANGKKLDGKVYTPKQKVQKIMGTLYKAIHQAVLRATAIILNLVIVGWLSVYYTIEAAVSNLTPASLRTLKSLGGRTVLVTGGAGGVGQELVIRLARQKAKVVVWDVNEKAMSTLKDRVAAEGFKIYTYAVDVSDKQSIYKNAETVKEEVGPVDILINNAGIVCGQTLLELPDYMIEKTYKVNTLSCYWTAKAFLPDMIKHGRGHIATVGSLTGLLGAYNCTDYSGSKYATIGFHESLSTELKSLGYDKIGLTMVCPYFINTGMFDGCKPSIPMLEPKGVAKRVILAIRQNEEFCTIPSRFNYLLPLKHYLPNKLGWLLQFRVLRTPHAMKTMRKFNEVEAA
ncbi:hypothetical protein YQE_12069, partial [Dendroctonus ponderosae]